MADNFLERQYAAYEEKKAAMAAGKLRKAHKKSSVQFYTRPGKPHTSNQALGQPE